MASRKIGGNSQTKEDDYIKEILNENSKFYKYEIPLMYKAFKMTLKYFFENCIEFKVNHFFEVKRVKVKETKIYVRYRDEYSTIPEHEEMHIKNNMKIKDYLNYRAPFKEVRRREILPGGERRPQMKRGLNYE